MQHVYVVLDMILCVHIRKSRLCTCLRMYVQRNIQGIIQRVVLNMFDLRELHCTHMSHIVRQKYRTCTHSEVTVQNMITHHDETVQNMYSVNTVK